MAPWDMKKVVEKIVSTGNQKILLTERGSVSGIIILCRHDFM